MFIILPQRQIPWRRAMAVKSSDSLTDRFTGRGGKAKLCECLLKNQLIAGNSGLAARIIKNAELIESKAAEIITEQGACDNDIYFLVAGSVNISINSREIAIRHSGTHFGEMALLDPTARRSATVKTITPATLLKVSEPDFTRIAKTYPDLWRRIATEVSQRMRERSKFIISPNEKPLIFVGSSSEGLAIANNICKYLKSHQITTRLWSKDVFAPSDTTIESLSSMTKACDFAILILSPDDRTKSRGRVKPAPRDNVVFELGLFIGGIGPQRTFMISGKETDLKIPTDLLGVTRLIFPENPKNDISTRLRDVKKKILNRITTLGPK